MLFIRSFSLAMLMLVNYLVLDLDFGMKAVRGDFHYWLPVDGLLGVFASIMLRVMSKWLCDFTGMLHLRHPQEIGGLYWTANT